MQKVINAGVGWGAPFCMAYLFTADGTKIVSGDEVSIVSLTQTWPPCHAIIHRYKTYGIDKVWRLFGSYKEHNLVLVDIRRRKTGRHRGLWNIHNEAIKINKSARWVLLKNSQIIGTWRKLPSTFLRELV